MKFFVTREMFNLSQVKLTKYSNPMSTSTFRVFKNSQDKWKKLVIIECYSSENFINNAIKIAAIH